MKASKNRGSHAVLTLRGRDWQLLSANKRTYAVETAFNYWRETGFPHYYLTEKEVGREYLNLCRQPIAKIGSNGIAGSSVGLRLANFFQPQMWSVRVSRYLSPSDVFHNDNLLRAAIRRSWSIWPDRFGANPATLRRILKTFPGAASVSNFRPTICRAVLNHFSGLDGPVIDFCAGYGGRLLGALSLNRYYIGIEPCQSQLRGLALMQAALEIKPKNRLIEILPGCAEDVMPLLPPARADLIFSSPPYFNWEQYSDDDSQSFVRFSSYEAWKIGFLEPIMTQSFRLLRSGGSLVLNVSNGRRLPNATDVRAISARLGFRLLAAFPLLITRVPYLHPRNDEPQKRETLLIFRRP